MRKSQLLVRLQTERDQWEQALNYVGSTRLGIGGVSGHWSVRDIVAHVMTREQYLADRLNEIQQGDNLPACQTQEEMDTFIEDFGYPDFESALMSEETANDWVVKKYRNTPFKDLVVLELHAYDSVYDAIKILTEERLNENKLFARISHYTIHHFQHHTADIRKRFRAAIKR